MGKAVTLMYFIEKGGSPPLSNHGYEGLAVRRCSETELLSGYVVSEQNSEKYSLT